VERSPARIAIALALPVALLVGVLIAALSVSRSAGPTAVEVPAELAVMPASHASDPDCGRLVAALSGPLDQWKSVRVGEADAGERAWRRDGAGGPVVLRCGVERPAAFTAASPVQLVDGVQWFGLTPTAWVAVDRPVYTALSLPADSGTGPIQLVSDAMARILPVRPLDPNPVR
jgi:hypothetical protein